MNYDQIWKFPIPEVLDSPILLVEMPKGAKFLHLAFQPQTGSPCIWAKVDTSKPLVARTVVIALTGSQPGAFIPTERFADYIGTLQNSIGLVLHFFLEKEGPNGTDKT